MSGSLAFEVIAAIVTQVTIFVLVTNVLQKWVGDSRASCRLWTICFLSILALIAMATLLPHKRYAFLPATLSSQTVLAVIACQTWIMLCLAIVWGTGFALAITRAIIRCYRVATFFHSNCVALTEAQIAELPLNHGKWENGIDGLQVYASESIKSPFCWQLHRPVIVMPRCILDGDEDTCRNVFVHEMEHLCTKHPMQHFLQGTCSTLLWFHPAVWTAAYRADLAREFMCDEAVIAKGGKLSHYLKTLIKIAEQCSSEPATIQPAGVLAFGNHKNALLRRCERLATVVRKQAPVSRRRQYFAYAAMFVLAAAASQIWLPTNALATSRNSWSPWPKWTASILHDFDIQVRDFETFDERTQIHELLFED